MAFEQQLKLSCYASYGGDMKDEPTIFPLHPTTDSSSICMLTEHRYKSRTVISRIAKTM